MPRAEVIQQQVYVVLTQNQIYERYIGVVPLYSGIFNVFYPVFWFVIRNAFGYPSRWDIALALPLAWISGMLNWWGFAYIIHWVGRALGGKASRTDLMGAMSLAYAPLWLMIASIIPGLMISAALLSPWIWATSYQAIRATYGLSWKRSVLVVVLPYIIAPILMILVLILGVLLGVFISSLIL
jgi:hypothetical protein